MRKSGSPSLHNTAMAKPWLRYISTYIGSLLGAIINCVSNIIVVFEGADILTVYVESEHICTGWRAAAKKMFLFPTSDYNVAG